MQKALEVVSPEQQAMLVQELEGKGRINDFFFVIEF